MKWRKVKKHFKRYDRDKFVGLRVCVDDVYGKITDVKIRPSGGKRIDYDFECDVTNDIKVAQSPKREDRGWYISCDVTIDAPKDKETYKRIEDFVNNTF